MDDGTRQERLTRMQALKDGIFTDWSAQLRCDVPQARKLAEPVLIDTLPRLYDDLILLACSAESPHKNSTLALEHGGERARLTRFDTRSLVREFQLFRHLCFARWDGDGIVLSAAEVAAVNHAIDHAISESIAGFVLMEEKFREQFFSALTHDMRTPLATATMAVEMIRHADQVDRIVQLADIASKQHRLLNQMISDLLDTVTAASNSDMSMQFVPVDLLTVAQEVAKSARMTYKRAVMVEGDPVNGVWCGSAIRRALENLVNNALKYGAKEGPVVVRMHQYGGRVALSVSNRGAPIAAEEMDSIFQLFRRTEQGKLGASGWGIGLPYVRSVAEQHGGSIVVESSEELTVFTIDIPLDARGVMGDQT